MSAYPLSIVVPPNTPASAPLFTQISVGARLLTGGRLSITPGSAGLVYARLLTRATPIYPATGEFINGDGEDFDFTRVIEMDGPPWYIRLEAYNLDDTYQHIPSALVVVETDLRP